MFKYLVLSLLNMLWYNKSVKVWIRNFSYLDFIFQNILSIFGFLAIILLIFKIESRLRYNCNRFLCFLRHKIIFAKQISKQKFALYDISIKYDSFLMISWEWTYTSFVTNVLSRWFFTGYMLSNTLSSSFMFIVFFQWPVITENIMFLLINYVI